MNAPAVTAVVYGLLVLAGGWIGFKKAGSRPSLISGAVSGALLFLAAALSLRGGSAGGRLAMGVALVLLVFFGYRFSRGRKFMPAGLMILASVAALAILIYSAP